MRSIDKEIINQQPQIHYFIQNDCFELAAVPVLPSMDPHKPTLVFDFDGVITQPQELKSQILREKGYDIPESCTDGPTAKQMMLDQHSERGQAGVTSDYEAVIATLYIDRILEIPPTENAVEVIQALANSKEFNLVILTSRHADNQRPEVQAAGLWLKTYGVKIDAVVATSNRSKLEALDQLKPAFFIDDSIEKLTDLFGDPHTCLQKNGALANTAICLFRQSTNQGTAPPGKIGTVEGGWQEVKQIAYALIKK